MKRKGTKTKEEWIDEIKYELDTCGELDEDQLIALAILYEAGYK